MSFINATPHEIKIYSDDKKNVIKTIPVGKFVMRLKTDQQKYINTIDGIPIYTDQKFTGIEVLDSLGKAVRFELGGDKIIVSSHVKQYIDENLSQFSGCFFVPDSNEGASDKMESYWELQDY